MGGEHPLLTAEVLFGVGCGWLLVVGVGWWLGHTCWLELVLAGGRGQVEPTLLHLPPPPPRLSQWVSTHATASAKGVLCMHRTTVGLLSTQPQALANWCSPPTTQHGLTSALHQVPNQVGISHFTPLLKEWVVKHLGEHLMRHKEMWPSGVTKHLKF